MKTTLRNLIGYLVLAACVLWTAAFGAEEEIVLTGPVTSPFHLTWDAQPHLRLPVLYWHVREVLTDGTDVFLRQSTEVGMTLDLPPGDHKLIVVGQNASPTNGGWSPKSDPILVTVLAAPPPPPPPPPVDPPPVKPTGLRIIPIFTSSTPGGPKKLNGHYVVNPEPDGNYPPVQFITTEAILAPRP